MRTNDDRPGSAAEAFRRLVEQYQGLVYSAAGRRLARVHDIEEVVQLTFLKLAKAAGTIRRDIAGWLYVTAINTANDFIRRDQTRRRHEAFAATSESFIEDAEKAEWQKLSLLVDEAVLELRESQRELIVEHFFRGRSQRDLAAQFDVSQPTILRRINGAVDELRRRLAKQGYTAAAPVLAATLAKVPRPPIPASVTMELVKIGLAGQAAGSVSFSAAAGGSLFLKVFLAVIVLLGLIAGLDLLLTSKPAITPVSASPTSAPAAAAPPDSRAALSRVYALQPGENLRFIPPPPLPERQKYLSEVEHNDSPMPFIQWRWIKGTLKRQWMQGGGPDGASVSSVLVTCAQVDAQEISMVGLPPIDADGDWIVRDGAATEAIVGDLHGILLYQFKLDIRFEKNEITKNAIIATGDYRFRRLPGMKTRDIQVFADVIDHPEPGDRVMGGGTTNAAEFWSMLGGELGIPIVDETKHEPGQIGWFLSFSIANADKDPGRRQIIPDNIGKQTGLVFKQEDHTFTTWKLSMDKKEPAASEKSN